MSHDVIQAKYDQLATIARQFDQRAHATVELRNRVARSAQALERDGWQGRGSTAFFAEMNTVIQPAMQRLIQALQEARSVTIQVSDIMRRAEEEAAAVFRGGAAIGAADGSVGKREEGKESGGFLKGVGDFFTGVWEEGKDSVVGLYNMVRHPIDTAKGIAHAVTHPAEFWEAFKQPYVEAWENGRPWEAIGRGVMFLGSALVGTKGADKLSKASKASAATRVTREAAEIASKYTPEAAASKLGSVAPRSADEAALGRYIAQQSTHRVPAPGQSTVPDRVILGAYGENKATGYLGYTREAQQHGGIYYSTTSEVWDVIQPVAKGGNGRGWAANREFVQSEMERGVARIELRGETIDDVFSDARRSKSDTANEINYLQDKGYEYGYRYSADENAWVKVGDWRASDTGRAAGAGTGIGVSLVDEAQSLNEDADIAGSLP